MLSTLRKPPVAGPAGLILTREESEAIAQRVLRLHQGLGYCRVGVTSSWLGDARWGRSRLSAAGDRRAIGVRVQRIYGYGYAEATTSRIDDEGLADVLTQAEQLFRDNSVSADPDPLPPRRTDFPATRIWSDGTLEVDADARAQLAERLLQVPKEAGAMSAGYLALGAGSASWFGTDGEAIYSARTSSQCSLTVRNQQGSGSGWAGASSFDWNSIDPLGLAERARQKCEASRNPSALEPGRYPVVLEPQAVGDLLDLIVMMLEREPAEQGIGPFADPKRPGFSKLGQRLIDQRINLSFDPVDPLLGVTPFDDSGEPVQPASWFERGVLMALAYSRRYAVNNFNENRALPNPLAVRMTGGDTSVEEMIASTRRGLLVSRFSGCNVLDLPSLLSTGHTRDGLWLIENGKITRPVKNFRFTDSPLFLLNSVETLGRPVPVFHPIAPMIVPPLKASSLNFTRLVDAV